MTSRRQSREEALQILYAFEISGGSLAELTDDPSILHPDKSPFEKFTLQLVEKALEASDKYDELTKTHARNWSFNRIAMIDRLIIRLSTTEFLHFHDIPPKVTIDEAVELAKKFSTQNSGRFVNGMLDSILTDLLNKHEIYKEPFQNKIKKTSE